MVVIMTATACPVAELSQVTIWVTIHWQTSHRSVDHYQHTSSIRPPPTTKAQLGPPDSCTSLPLWLTQLGFSSFIFNLIFFFLNLLLSFFQQTIHPAISWIWELSPNPHPFVSNSGRHFVVLVIQLHLCSRIPETEPSSCWLAPRTTGEVTPARAGSVSVIFDRGPE